MAFDLSIQLYTLRSHTQRDLEGTLKTLSAFGYESVEFAGLCGHTPEAVAAMLRRTGIRASGAHVPYEEAAADLQTLCVQYGALDAPELTVPYLPGHVRRNLGGWLRVAEVLDKRPSAVSSSPIITTLLSLNRWKTPAASTPSLQTRAPCSSRWMCFGLRRAVAILPSACSHCEDGCARFT